MINIFVEFAYKGNYFYGSQKQSQHPSVQGLFEEKFASLYQEKIKFTPCSRLDRGVHAKRMGGNFKVSFARVKTDKLPYALNRLLPPYIRVLDAKEVPLDFNARFDAKRKVYLYRINLSRDISPFDFDLSFYDYKAVDPSKIEKVLNLFTGTHDFKFFSSPESDDDTIITIDRVSVTPNSNYLDLRVEGKRFLRHQVRFMVGAALAISRGNIDFDYIKERLDCRLPATSKYKAPAHGLYLESVEYDFERSKNV